MRSSKHACKKLLPPPRIAIASSSRAGSRMSDLTVRRLNHSDNHWRPKPSDLPNPEMISARALKTHGSSGDHRDRLPETQAGTRIATSEELPMTVRLNPYLSFRD